MKFISKSDLKKSGAQVQEPIVITDEGYFYADDNFPFEKESERNLEPLPEVPEPEPKPQKRKRRVPDRGEEAQPVKREFVARRASPFIALYEKTLENNPSEWLKAMALQCHSMFTNPPKGMCCKNLRAYRERWLNKLEFYVEEDRKRLVENPVKP
jgi:hypothetical protein